MQVGWMQKCQIWRQMYQNCFKTAQQSPNEIKLYDYNIDFKKEIMVPGAGLEPARPYERGILNPLCLPISPPGHRMNSYKL